MAFVPTLRPSSDATIPVWWFAFSGDDLVLARQGDIWSVPRVPQLEDLSLQPCRTHYLGRLQGQTCYAADLPGGRDYPPAVRAEALRSVYPLLGDELFGMAVRALQVLRWDRTHKYCGRCGSKTEAHPKEAAKICPRCGLMAFPRLDPVVIVAIRRGSRILLARARRFRQPMFSVVAGFVEVGETLEEAIHREVKEEVGIQVHNLRYVASQQWPYPHSMMIGFSAEYAGGEVVPDGEEIVEAAWFEVNALPRIPDKASIARRLIDRFVAECRVDEGHA